MRWDVPVRMPAAGVAARLTLCGYTDTASCTAANRDTCPKHVLQAHRCVSVSELTSVCSSASPGGAAAQRGCASRRLLPL